MLSFDSFLKGDEIRFGFQEEHSGFKWKDRLSNWRRGVKVIKQNKFFTWVFQT